jgi:uncharacterized protein
MKKGFLYIVLIFCFGLTAKAQEKLDIFDIARKGTVQQAKELVKSNPKVINETNKDGFSALILACYRGNNEVAKFLIVNGSDINGNSDMGTPLMAAIVKGNNEMATFLIDKKANVNLADANGVTSLIYSVQFQNIDIIEVLLKNKADQSHKDKQGKTAFEYAAFSGNEKIINLLKSN